MIVFMSKMQKQLYWDYNSEFEFTLNMTIYLVVTLGLVVRYDSGRFKMGSSVILDCPEKRSMNINEIK